MNTPVHANVSPHHDHWEAVHFQGEADARRPAREGHHERKAVAQPVDRAPGHRRHHRAHEVDDPNRESECGQYLRLNGGAAR